MACKLDVEKAILDKVMDELVEGRYTFTRLSNDSIQINGKVDNSNTKAKTANQAMAIGNELLNRTKKSFMGHVTGYVAQNSAYDPVTVTFRVSKPYIDYEYNRLPTSEKNDTSTT